MENEHVKFKLKTWHFAVILLGFIILTNIIGTINLKAMPAIGNDSTLKEVDRIEMTHNTIDFILFYSEEAESCKKMEYNLDRLARQVQNENTGFYKININERPDIVSEYNISGVPCTLIFNNGEECNRIMGIVSQSNLEMIYNRISNQQSIR